LPPFIKAFRRRPKSKVASTPLFLSAGVLAIGKDYRRVEQRERVGERDFQEGALILGHPVRGVPRMLPIK